MPILEVEDLSLSYGVVQAVDDVSFAIEDGEWVSIVGPNGAGKTSLLNLVSGFEQPDEGRIHLFGEDVTYHPSWRRARDGLGRTFQQGELFEHEDIIENMLTIRDVVNPTNVLESVFYWGPGRRKEVENVRAVEELIDYLELWEHRHKPIALLPLGLRRRVELGRALALEPDVLLLDEVMSGLTFDEKYDMVRFVSDLHEQENLTVVMIEHDLNVVTSVSDRMLVMAEGALIADGPPDEVTDDPEVSRVYTGVQETGTEAKADD